MSEKRRRSFQHLRQELKELDYSNKLTAAEKEWVTQFYYEYYQGDFDAEGAIHPPELKKECQTRNNAAKRQMHSVGDELIDEAVARAYKAQGDKKTAHRYYLREDYSTFHEKDEDENDN